jgi:NADH-quinone oxidoreductase subunit H
MRDASVRLNNDFTMNYFLLTILFFLTIIILSAYLSLAERKIIARVQRRIGPHYCGICGCLQPIADAIKILFKENPSEKKSKISVFSICLLLGLNLFLTSLIPFSNKVIILNLDNGLLYVVLLDSLITMTESLIGISSGSKYGIIGGTRAYIQSLGTSFPIFLSTIVIFLKTGTFNLLKIAESQRDCPFALSLFPTFVAFCVISLVILQKPPFDFSEAESELVAGSKTEYGGILFGMIYLGEYLHIFSTSALISILFLGGRERLSSCEYTLVLLCKIFIVIFFIFIIRAVFPRCKQEKMIKIAWFIITPVLLLEIFIVTVTK